MKDEEKEPLTLDVSDPKPPVIHAGHLENRIRHDS